MSCYNREYRCVRCKAMIHSEGTIEPLECYKNQGGCGKSIASTRFKLILDEENIGRGCLSATEHGHEQGQQSRRIDIFSID